MGSSTFLRNIYHLDTLDTRFTSSSSVPYHTVVDARSDPAVVRTQSDAKGQGRTQPPKWRTPEFYLYYVVFAIAVPYMFWVPYSVSRRTLYSTNAVFSNQSPRFTRLGYADSAGGRFAWSHG
jgi:protein-cysteine N-palmitoyltransferase HHAT